MKNIRNFKQEIKESKYQFAGSSSPSLSPATGNTATATSENILNSTAVAAAAKHETEDSLFASCEESRLRANHHNQTFSTRSMCLVHLGKTAGSTITCMMNYSVQHSGKGNSQCSTNATTTPTTAISRRVSQRIHLEPAPVQDFDAFLITLRNPLDRIKSWYYYLHPDYPPVKLPKHKRACDNFFLFDCYPTWESFLNVGLADHDDNHYNDDKCKAWAWGAATGSRHCWHNYWNYNRTYGPLLDFWHDKNNNNNNVFTQKTVFAIRTEQVWEDFNTIDIMLGGRGQLLEDPSLLPNKNRFNHSHSAAIIGEKHKNTTAIGTSTPANKRTTNINPPYTNLCRALCHEIQIYKQLLQISINLCPSDKKQSIDELLVLCPNEVEQVRDCV